MGSYLELLIVPIENLLHLGLEKKNNNERTTNTFIKQALQYPKSEVNDN